MTLEIKGTDSIKIDGVTYIPYDEFFKYRVAKHEGKEIQFQTRQANVSLRRWIDMSKGPSWKLWTHSPECYRVKPSDEDISNITKLELLFHHLDSEFIGKDYRSKMTNQDAMDLLQGVMDSLRGMDAEQKT